MFDSKSILDLTGNQGASKHDGWTPRYLRGLSNWYESHRGIVLNGSNLATWRDLSGYGRHAVQAVGSSQCAWVASAIGGRPAVRFNGSTSFMTAPVPDPPGPRTYAFAFSSTRNAANRVFDYQTTTHPLFGFYFDGTRHLFMSGATNYRYSATSTQPSDGARHSCIITVPGLAQADIGNLILEIDGSPRAGSAPVVTGTAVQSATTILLGGSNTGTRFSGDFYKFVIVNRALSAIERDRLNKYLLLR